MPVEQVIWKLGEIPVRLKDGRLLTENELEEIICKDTSILDDKWLLIGRQVITAFNGIIDLLAIDDSASLIVIELKKNKTSRDVVAQAIDYASWVQSLDSSSIADIFERYSQKYLSSNKSLDQTYFEKFGYKLSEEDLNTRHKIIIVSSELDSSSERIIQYLNDQNIPVNAVFFRVFKDNETRYLSRAWFIDPAETQEIATIPKSSEPWNKEYYVSFGHGMGRDWEDARQYGFISGGGGRWYNQTLNLLKAGDRIWANIPQTGYVGVGIVEAPAVKVDKFYVQTDKGLVPFMDVQKHADYLIKWLDNEDKAEYVVKVKWLHAVPIKDAVSEVGFFGNQNTVCRPTTAKWVHTVERLKAIFNINP
jgi:hypothetical protein